MGYHALLCNEKYEDSCEALENCMILSFYHAVEIINPSQGADLTGSRRGVVMHNYR